MRKIFVYGSLMFDDVWHQVLKGKHRKIPAYLDDYRRVKIHGEVYPGLIKHKGEQVAGALVFGLNQQDVKILDEFEGHYYRREEVAVLADDGNCYDADVYLIREKYKYLLSKSSWDIEKFRDRHLRQFIHAY